MKTNNLSIIKKANQCLVLNTVMDYEPITVDDIAHKTRLSRPTILTLLKQLTQDEVIHISGRAESLGGRQAALYAINTTSMFSMGIDFDYPPLRLNISDIKGNPVYSKTYELSTRLNAMEIVEKIINIIEECVADSKIDKSKIAGIGLGIPGTVDISKNRSVKIDRLPSWHDIAVDEIIQKRTGLEVHVRNNAHLLGIAEKNLLDRNTKDLLYFINSVGIGMAIFRKGKLYEGSSGNPGYIGHTSIDINGEQCECGQKGCVELYCSKSSIVRKYHHLESPSHQPSNYDRAAYQKILEAADNGDADAIDVLTQAGIYLGTAISNAIRLFDVPNIVVGGLECSKDNVFFTTIKKTVMEKASSFSVKDINVYLGQLTEETYGLGGCQFIIEKIFAQPKLRFKVN